MQFPASLMAGLAEAAHGPPDGPRVQAYFANMLRAVAADHAGRKACAELIEDTGRRLAALTTSDPPSWEKFYYALIGAIEKANDRYFYQKREPVDVHLNLPAVTFQCADNAALAAWMDGPATATSLARAVRVASTKAGALVGLPGRAVWLTPLKGPVEALIKSARAGPDPDLAKAARNLIANSGWQPRSVIVALITRQPIGELQFSIVRNGRAQNLVPVGSTVLEAGTHKHFRHWPLDGGYTDRYGRTYDLDPRARSSAKPPLNYGIPEAVRSRIPLDLFSDCLVMGVLTPGACSVTEPDADFLQAVGGMVPPAVLLSTLLGLL